jgi:hypothetical protein
MSGIRMVSERPREYPVLDRIYSPISFAYPKRPTRQTYDRETRSDGYRFEYNARSVRHIEQVPPGVDFWGSWNDGGWVRLRNFLIYMSFYSALSLIVPSFNTHENVGITVEELTTR